MTLKFFLPKGGSCLSHFIGSRVVQNAFFRGYSRFYIHFWPENAQKTTLKFLTFFGPRHLPLLLGWSKMVFQGVIFDSVSITGENRPKNDLEIFLAERVEDV